MFFDVVEPSSFSSIMTRLRYQATVTNGVAAVVGKTADTRGFFALSVTIVNQVAAQRLAALNAIANESALTYNPRSPCQLIDQITPNRGLSADLSAGFPRVRQRLPSHGRIRALIVPIDFPDVPGIDNPVTHFTPIADGMRDFYYAQSYGRLAFNFAVLPKWLRMNFASTKHNQGGGVGTGDPSGYRREIVDLTDGLIDYNNYDAVYFLLPKEIPTTSISWGPAITSPITTRNGYITNGATGGADMYTNKRGDPRNDWKWMAHETGHAFGLYDEDLDHASATLGSWSLMADSWSPNAFELGGWDRYLLGWLSETQVACISKHHLTAAGTTLKLNPLVRQNSDTKVAIVPLSTTKSLVLESRKRESYDTVAAGREGVLVYTVDMTVGQLKGGYRTQRRNGSTLANFEDAALRTGDSITVEGFNVSVTAIDASGDTISLKSTPDAANRVLSVTRAGLGVGTVTSSPSGINCTPTCFASFALGSTVTLNATPTAGSVFTGWTGDCSGTGACTVPMSSAKNVTASFFGQTSTTTFTGLWWNPAESGWGISMTQRAGITFVAWYTYDTLGAPVWYVMSNCAIDGYSCTGEMYAVSGGQTMTVPWTRPALSVSVAGRGTFTFTDANNGTFAYTLNGVTGVKTITRQIFSTGTSTTQPADFSALYWAAPANSESGWGVSLTQQGMISFIALYTYEASGKPIWYVASNCVMLGNGCSGALYQVNGGRVPTSPWGTPALDVKQVGAITFTFTDAINGTMNYTINNVAGSKPITKQIF